eukprot:TRINITY_DN71202_c0_g1_i1.p1 TRINITY_DN71202_c0_g1~~TRINITY_DN71202_c0_g1_i1.p1  ORF type:complete len:400 (-),score=54.41 TRINITY_DN71202_c0_g1_i1:117-1316(-)
MAWRRRNAHLSEEDRAQLLASLDEACADAAVKISTADVLLLCTGAGFSADSGLAVYADVAEVDAYKARDLHYHDICQPGWLQSEPDLFWGFWGQCFNDYRDTAPHEGFEIIERWVERWFRHSTVAEEMRRRLSEDAPKQCPFREDPTEAYSVDDHAGAFFVFTSNVDAHHFDWFRACEIHECHGNTELYQCTDDLCPRVWRAPSDFRFEVDHSTMLAPRGPPSTPGVDNLTSNPAVVDDGAKPAVGRVRGGGRPRMLRYMPGSAPGCEESGFTSNHPTCPTCGSASRPAILMFGDFSWKEMRSQAWRFDRWTRAVEELAKERKAAGEALRVVVLEVGAGTNVPTVRLQAESIQERTARAGADSLHVRMNLGEPLGYPGVVNIMAKGLDGLRRIDAAMPK